MSSNIVMDGVVVMDPGNGGPAMQAQYRDHCRGEGPHVQLSGRVRPRIGSPNHRGDQDRHQPVPLVRWTMSSAIPILELKQQDEQAQRDREALSPSSATRGSRSAGRSGRAGGNNKLFFFFAQEWNPRQQGNDVVRFRMPTALERKGDFSQMYDNTGATLSVHQGSAT